MPEDLNRVNTYNKQIGQLVKFPVVSPFAGVTLAPVNLEYQASFVASRCFKVVIVRLLTVLSHFIRLELLGLD